MKINAISLAVLCLTWHASAFPQLLQRQSSQTSIAPSQTTLTPTQTAELSNIGQGAVKALSQTPVATPGFNAALQRIDVSGVHAWRAPGPNDQRGPCPGLNALANHGYLPRNGVGSILDFITATNTVYGMGLDLSVILAAYGAVFDGALPLGWSIGGGVHTGIGGSHGHYETDNSPMRADLNQYGSNTRLVLGQFQEFFDLQPDAATANYDIDVLSQFRGIRFNESIAKNPYFYYGPFAGTTVSQAAFSFIYRFMANHTEANPAGILNQDVLKSFFAVSGDDGDFTWNPGHERIPDNWYRRAIGDEYTLDGLGSDTTTFASRTPRINTPGCNTGTVNSFVAIDTSYADYDFSTPTQGVCFALAEVLSVAEMLPVVGIVVDLLVLPVQNALDCRTVPARNDSVKDVCPGYSFYGGPTGMVAPGAGQD
ncbi:hypothetical protein M409DRAFT_22676 [Zasmidium cellare ATCC 36951]|uniref:Heme haloperoxidase family profile domain-containing protein n=1 Tax=Zasmidium cellare ATCC 36951 TaxID=1080233 RepID=A0A6A6CND3_ZASCE|nr:uncharacterized protein M409DRAFT_22676 [Zasmidium cellare ATCC 36951]KAF2167249.1 hypothetical protein M409DRAFT_22676 [Zasmidium cellare ATCC 36951]